MIKLNCEKSNKCREKITPEQIEEIRCFFMTDNNNALKLNDVKEAVWRASLHDPTDPTVLIVQKIKTLNELPKTQQASPKIQRDEHICSF